MKKTGIISIIALLLFFGQCKEIDKLTQFDLDYTSEVTIPANAGINIPIDILTPDIETNTEDEFAVNDTRKDLVEEITLKEAKLRILSPDGQNFDFLKTIRIYIRAEGLDEQLIAWKENIADGSGSELALNTSDEDLKVYIKKESFKLRFYVKTDQAITQDIKIEAYSRFFVDAKVLGI